VIVYSYASYLNCNISNVICSMYVILRSISYDGCNDWIIYSVIDNLQNVAVIYKINMSLK